MKIIKEFLFGKSAPEEPKLPHEVFPDIIYWEIGDHVWYDDIDAYHWKYLGLLDGKVYLRTDDEGSMQLAKGKVVALSINTAKYYCSNAAASNRKANKFQETLAHDIKSDSYNEFLKILREKQDELWETWTNNANI